MQKIIQSLHPLERKVLSVLKDNKTVQEIQSSTTLQEVDIIRALQWLESKKVLKIKTDETEMISLGDNGRIYLKKGLPERQLLNLIKSSSNLSNLKNQMSNEEFSVALGTLKKYDAIKVSNEKVSLTFKGKKLLKNLTHEEKLLEHLSKKILQPNLLKGYELESYDSLKKRKDIINVELLKNRSIELTDLGYRLLKEDLQLDLIDSLTSDILKSKSWKKNKFRRYNLNSIAPRIYPGKRHFVNQAIEYAKRLWLDLGFKEMTGPVLESSFWNFDALFVAQDHPGRDMQDTFFIKGEAKIKEKEIIKRIKGTHENGWTTGSKGWQYVWDQNEAKKLVLRPHTTNLSARTISRIKKEETPAKFFSVGKVFRNETVDWSHLFEFYQTDGIVIDENMNFKHLLGYLNEFFDKMGYSKARFRPAYFPYTEPSVEVEVLHPIRKEWIELGGAGIFRPEVTKPLMGTEVPVLAWGLGIGRILTDYYKINDLRELYKNDIKQLREIKMWMK